MNDAPTQLKLLVESYFDPDPNRFITVVLQMAATEAQLGNQVFAKKILKLVLDGGQLKRKFPRIKNSIIGMLKEFSADDARELANKIKEVVDHYDVKRPVSTL